MQQVSLWEPCCSLEIIEEPSRDAYDWTVGVREETAQRRTTVMANDHQVQEEMRQATKAASIRMGFQVLRSPCADHMNLHEPRRTSATSEVTDHS